jgi:uncharacterized protein YbjT (DUF2867 family)
MVNLHCKTAVIIGASGAVGHHFLDDLIETNRYENIYLIVRKSLGFSSHPVIHEQVISEISAENINVSESHIDLFCTLGTTLKKVGSIDAFVKIDRDLVVNLGKWGKQKEFCAMHVISYVGADADSNNYYAQTKGQMEQQLISLDLPSLTLYRPSLLYAPNRPDFRFGEALGFYVMQLFSWIPLPIIKRYKPVSVSVLAEVMVKHSEVPRKGVNIIYSEEMHKA